MSRINVENIRHPDASVDSISLNSSARVGIGESSPNRQLVINGGTSEGVVQITNDTSGTAVANGFELIHFTNGETQLLNRENGAMRFDTNNSEAMRIDASGRLLVGTQSTYDADGDDLVVETGGNTGITIATTSTSSTCSIHFADGTTGANAYRGNLRYNHSTNNLSYSIGDTHAWTTDVSQRFLLGHTSAVTNLRFGGSGDFGARQYIYGANQGFNNGLAILNYDATASIPAILKLGSSRNDTPGNNGLVGNADNCCSIQMMGNDGVRFIDLVRLDAIVDSSPGEGDMPGSFRVNVTRNGQTTVTERLRISENGRTSVFTTDTDAFEVGDTTGTGTTRKTIRAYHSATGVQNGTEMFFVRNNGDVRNATGSYSSISDAKLKENIVDAPSQWEDIKALQVRKFNFTEESNQARHTQIGLIAQEAEIVCPGLVDNDPDRDENGEDLGTVTKGVKYSVLYMKSVKALQEAMTRIETLEARLSVLEGGAN